jgi:ABC-2 type transport system permease protein
MIDALRFEWVRIRTLRSTYWLTVLPLVLSGAVAGIISYVSRDDPIQPDLAGVVLTGGSAFSPLPFTAVFMGIMGVFAFGHEYRHGTILPTLTAVPKRGSLVFAKALVIAVWALVLAVVSVLINWGLAKLLAGDSLPITSDQMGPALLGYLGFVVLWGLLGLGLGSLLRNLPAAMVLLFVVPLVVEPLLGALTMIPALESLREYVNYLPFTSGNAMSQTVSTEAVAPGASFGDQPSRAVSSLTFTAWVAALFALATTLFHKRDA